MLRRAHQLFAVLLSPVLMLLLAGPSLAQNAESGQAARWETNMTPGVTEVSREIFDLHMLIFWICVVIGIVVFGIMFYTMIMHRKSKRPKPDTWHESTLLEVVWTLIPFAILIGMAIPATNTLIKIYDTEESDVDVLITGYQWKWKYDYINDDVSFFSNMLTSRDEVENRAPKGEHYLLDVDEPLVIPVGKKVRFLVTANDVIHSWWVPALGVKRDAIPGFINEAWTRVEEPGIYRGQCAELCGKDHGFMPVVVRALPQAEYDQWLAQRQEAQAAERELANKTFTLDELMDQGEQVYNRSCAACHGAQGQGVPGAFPAIAGSSYATGDLDKHLDIVVNGSAQNPAMQAFGDQLSEVQLAAVLTYQRNAFGNDTGDVVQPIDVLKFKQGN